MVKLNPKKDPDFFFLFEYNFFKGNTKQNYCLFFPLRLGSIGFNSVCMRNRTTSDVSFEIKRKGQ